MAETKIEKEQRRKEIKTWSKEKQEQYWARVRSVKIPFKKWMKKLEIGETFILSTLGTEGGAHALIEYVDRNKNKGTIDYKIVNIRGRYDFDVCVTKIEDQAIQEEGKNFKEVIYDLFIKKRTKRIRLY